MATYTRRLEISLLQSGLTTGSALGYTVQDASGATLIARTTTGVTEDGTSANYYVTVAGWDTSWSGTVIWDAGAGTLSRDAFLDRRDIFTTALPGSYASGSAGNIIGGILDSVVSTKGTVLASPSPTRTAFSATIPTTVSDTVLQAGSTIKFLSGPNAFAFLPILTATRTGTSTTVALTFASPGFLAAPGTDSFVIY